YRILLGHRNECRAPTWATGHIERLGIGRTWQRCTEGRIATRARRSCLRDERGNVQAVPCPVQMMLEDIACHETRVPSDQTRRHVARPRRLFSCPALVLCGAPSEGQGANDKGHQYGFHQDLLTSRVLPFTRQCRT